MCVYVDGNVLMVTSYLCESDLSKERAEWEQRNGGTAPRQRPRKDRVAGHIFSVCVCVCLFLVVCIVDCSRV